MRSPKDGKNKLARAKPSRLLDEQEPEVGVKRQTRLHLDDDDYVRTKITNTNKSEAAVIRNLVRKGVKAERLERAARDPVVNNLLGALEQVLSGHTEKIERRLSAEFHTIRRLTATAIVLANASMRILEAYVATAPPPDQRAIAERRKTFFGTLYKRLIGEAEGVMEGMLDERESILILLAEKGLTTTLRDADLEAALESLRAQPDEGKADG